VVSEMYTWFKFLFQHVKHLLRIFAILFLSTWVLHWTVPWMLAFSHLDLKYYLLKDVSLC
jgi:hypothetical protein